jgi:LytS/YehU family sensor histidine kinase
MILAGILISLLLHSIMPNPDLNHSRIYDFVTSIVITIIVWEGNLRIDNAMNIKFPWVVNPGKRLIVHTSAGMVFSVMAIYFPMLFFDSFVCRIPAEKRGTLMITCIVIGLLVTVIIIAIEISTQFFSQWKKSLVEVERYKTESVQAQLQNLKEQINPHFLFNNMSVLSSLVYKDQDKAVDFINQLSKVYRYLLDNKSSELVTLATELEFIKSYTYLLQIRFDSNIVFNTNIDSDSLKLLIPPMSLQMLIENTIKHNEVSAEQPLIVTIEAKENVLTVSNNLQPRTVAEPSSKTGLNNIRERYKYYSNREIEVIKNASSFVVKLPLLNVK